MANRRELVKRRRATTNIRKITRTMQLIATAQFQAAFNRAVAGRPYADKLAEMVSDLARAARDIEHPLMAMNEDAPARALVVLTSNRGLCGGYNAHVLRRALDFIEEESQSPAELRLHMVGKK
ncbi:MAG TPA: F0F1 ATP synthase subunit gamma, partial [Thermoanaerobaculia bacterium]|nr:F0F1 ATP synthase subunit gamma [Thermoanaerobaculia bacterium]